MPSVELITGRLSSLRDIIHADDLIVLDCDGVVWRENEPIKEAIEAINALALQHELLFVTNTNSASRIDIRAKLSKMGVIGVEEDKILTSSYLAVKYLADHDKRNLLLLGAKGAIKEAKHFNIKVKNCEDISANQAIDAIIVGMDKEITYEKIDNVSRILRENPDILFIATNTDPILPGAGTDRAGTGAIVSAISCAAKRLPIVVGKPSDYLAAIITEKYPGKRIVLIGDNLETDIVLANKANAIGVLVESGVHKEADIHSLQIPCPYVIRSLRIR